MRREVWSWSDMIGSLVMFTIVQASVVLSYDARAWQSLLICFVISCHRRSTPQAETQRGDYNTTRHELLIVLFRFQMLFV